MVDHLIAQEAEAELVRRAQEGDRSAFEELVYRYYPGVVNVVYRLCGEVMLAEDIAQETFLRAWINLPLFRPQSPVRNWLYRIALNALRDVLRRKTEENMNDEDILMAATWEPDPEALLVAGEQSSLIQRAIQSLPEATRRVLVLREYADLSYQEIASVLDIPIGTVMSRLSYARQCLAKRLKAQLLAMECDECMM